MEEHKGNCQNMPQNNMVTTSRPDLVVVDTSPPTPTVYLFELTVCFERMGNMGAASAVIFSYVTIIIIIIDVSH